MAIPFTKVYLSTAVSNALTGYRFFPQAAGDFAPTVSTLPTDAWASGIADLDGDGIADVVIGAPGDDDKDIDAGRIFIELSRASGTLASGTATTEIIIDGVNAGDLSGASIDTITDLNNDGKAEILIGAPGVDNGALADAGAGFVIWGLGTGSVDLGDPLVGDSKGYVIKGEAIGDKAGQAMASISDLNGDGKAEVLIGATGNDAAGIDAGAAYVVWGKSSSSIVNLSTVSLGTGGYRIIGQNAGDGAGQALARLADQNGDGKAEVIVGAAGNDAGGVNAGAAYVVFGKATGSQVDLDNIASGIGGYRITGTAGAGAGSAVTALGDINADGIEDILVGASGLGKAYVVFGKNDTSEVLLSNVANGIGGFVINPELGTDLARLSVTGGADFNRDGINDIVIGAPTNNEGGSNAGAVYIVWGGENHAIDLAAVAQGMGGAKIVGSAGSLTGSSVSVLQDMNGDGTADLLIGSPGSVGESVSVLYSPSSWLPDSNIYGTNGNDVMDVGYGGTHKIGIGDDAILGLNGNDTIHGSDGNDSIDGNAGNDVLYGDAGHDVLDGGTGNDSLIGGAGDDTYKIDSVSDVVQENSGEGNDTAVATISGYTLAANVENLQLSGVSLSGAGNELNNSIIGTAGNDTLNGGVGADTLAGGLGNDNYIVDTLADVIQEANSAGTDTVTTSIDWSLSDNLENLVLTGLAHTGTGNTLNNSITGSTGNDTLDGGLGNDSLAGGLGDDTYYVDGVTDSVQEAALAGTDTVITGVNYSLAANLEVLQLIGTALTGTGNSSNNTIIGNNGNNTLDGGAGSDTLIGGLGDDTYYVDNLGDVIQEDANAGNDTVITSLDGYVLSAGSTVENLALSGSALSATGNELANILTGTAGNNTLNGGLGVDTLKGGAGDDTYYVDDASDVIEELAGAGTDTVITSTDYTLADNIENLQFTGSIGLIGSGNASNNMLTGTLANDTLYGLSGNDTLDGGLGNDSLVGGDGDDTYTIDNINDVVVEIAGGGIDRVYTNIDNWIPSDNIENISLTGNAHTVTGNASNNSLTGNTGDDTIDGGDGDDLEAGGDGDDVLISGAGLDTLAGGSGDDRYVLTGGSATIEDFLGHDTVDASDASGDSSIDLSTGVFHVEGQDCHTSTAGTTSSPLDVQFLQDLTGSFLDDIATVRSLVPQIVSALQAAQANSEFGVSTFRDKAIGAFGGVGDWVYQMPLALTTATASLTNAYASMVANNGADGPEAQIEALMQLALHSAEVGFRPDSAHFVVLFTDAPFHNAGDGASAGITTPNNGDAIMDAGPSGVAGTGEDYPIIAQVQSALAAANIIPIFAVAGGYEATYQGLVTSLGRGAVVTLTANSSNVVAAITGGLTQATTTRIEDADGGVGNDALTGNVLDNRLTGNGGSDTVVGNEGNDSLVGATGDDILTGGSGDDTFIFAKGDGHDEITDDSVGNTATDVVHFTDVASTDVVSVSQVAGTNNLLLVYGSGEQLIIDGYFGANPDGSIARFEFSDGVNWLRADILSLISGGNTAPALTGITAVLSDGIEDTTQIITQTQLLQGYSDADGDTLSVVNLSADHGSFVDNGDGSWTFTPTANYNGATNLSYQVSDGRGGVLAASSSFNLAAVNDQPVLSGVPATLPDTNKNTSVMISAVDLLAGYSDVDGDTLSVTGLIADNGTLVDNGDGTWTYQPSANYVGAVNLAYNVSDGQGGNIPASQAFNVIFTNSNPAQTSALATLATGSEDQAYIISSTDLLIGYSDSDGDTLSVANLTVDNGVLTDNLDGTWTLTPTANYNGLVTLSYDVIDGQGGSAAAVQMFNLAAVNDSPELTGSPALLADGLENTDYWVFASDLLMGFSDVDGDILSIANLTVDNGTLTQTASDLWTLTPNANYFGTVNLSYDVIDGNGGSVATAQSLVLQPTNTAPVIGGMSIAAATVSGTTINYAGSLSFTDADSSDTHTSTPVTATGAAGGMLATSLSESSGAGTVSLHYSYTLPATFGSSVQSTTDSFAITVDDGQGGVVSQNVAVTVTTGTSSVNTLTGGNGIDILVGAGGNDVLNGLDGNDVLAGSSGADSMLGGLGDDVYLVDNAADVITEAANEGIDQVISSVSYSLAANVEKLIISGTASLNGTGNNSDNVIVGGSGSNILDGLAGADTMMGGLGNDTFIVDDNADSVVEAAGEGTDTLKSWLSFDLNTVTNVENLTLLGVANNNATGNAGANTMTGNSGNNVLTGGAGADKLIGGGGDDTYVVNISAAGAVEDTVTANTGLDTVLVQGSYTGAAKTITAVTAVEVYDISNTGSSLLNLTGNASDNVLIGNEGNNVLTGGAGIDSMAGGLGNDTYVIDDLVDVVNEASGGGIDTIKSSISFNLNSVTNIENLTLTGTANIDATGDAGANTITGNTGNNILIGGAGVDNLIGGGGNDTYIVNITGQGTLEDTVTAKSGIDTLIVQGNYAGIVKTLTAASTIENYDISATGNSLLNVTGNASNNILTGNDAANQITGGAGIDTMSGGLGDDVYGVDNVSDSVVEVDGAGIDKVNSSVSFDLSTNGVNVEQLSLTGNALVNATGNNSDNTLTGNAAANILLGNDGNDILIGAGGNDSLTGGAGADVFRFNATVNALSNVDTINDFVSGTDVLQFSSAVMNKLGAIGQFSVDDARFWVNTTGLAHDADDRLIYNSSTGELFYDNNGSVTGGAVLVEVLTGATALSATDIWAI